MNIQQEKEYRKYMNKGFTPEQLEEIRLGIEQGFDVKAYARFSISPEDMSHIRKSMAYQRKIESESNAAQKQPASQQPSIQEELQRKKEKLQLKMINLNSISPAIMANGSIILGSVSIAFALIAIIIKISG